uniref:Uncharacterized protein n=1 Tax=Quercus lobata TaxID=97700 RepID=A0A7N2QXW9_QUELO
MSPEVRSSGLKANLSSNADTGGVETNIAISVLLPSRPIHLCFTLVPHPFIHNGASSLSKHSPRTTYAKFMENRHKSYVKDRLELENRFEVRAHAVVEYTSIINDFDDLVDPRTIARHCLGPEPSHYILRAIHREEKKMTTKFSQEFYAWIKEISSVPSHEMVNRHVHKLVQVMHITSQYLASEEKAVMATLKVEALEAEASGLSKDLIVAMEDNNEQLAAFSQKMKSAVAKAVHTFQLTEYNAILFGWYFKGFELLRRYLIKHGPEIDLEDLDFEAVDKEIEANEATQAAQVTKSVGEDPLVPERGGNDAPEA